MSRFTTLKNQTVVAMPEGRRPSPPSSEGERWARRLRTDPTAVDAVLCLAAIAAFSVLLRMALVSLVHAPTIFSDELGYVKLAQSIGRTGHFALFDDRGLSYSPLYPALLAPIYAIGASAPTAYTLIKLANAVLISLAVFPTYGIARSVLPRSASLVVALMIVFTPLMFYSSFSMSENLAFPVCLTAIWAMIAAIRVPRPRADALLLVSLLAAAAARIQLVMLFPAAVTAIVLASALGRDRGARPLRAIAATIRRHILLFSVLAAALVTAGAAAVGGYAVYSIFGRYAAAARTSLPNVWHFLYVLAQHVSGEVIAVGFVPFIAALVAAAAFARAGFPRQALPFAAVALSVSVWLLAEVALDAAIYDGRGPDLSRIHERFLIYLVPFFLVSLLAVPRISEARASLRVFIGAAVIVALLPLAIPFDTVVNGTIIEATPSMEPFAYARVAGRLTAIPHALEVVIGVATILGVLYLTERRRTRSVVLLVLFVFSFTSLFRLGRVVSAADNGRSLLPARTDWVDAAKPVGSVVLLSGPGSPGPARETAYNNLSIDRLYSLCELIAGPEFGEQHPAIDSSGRLRTDSGPITAAYAVAPTRLAIRGRVVARNIPGREVLVKLPGGRLNLPPSLRSAALDCGS